MHLMENAKRAEFLLTHLTQIEIDAIDEIVSKSVLFLIFSGDAI